MPGSEQTANRADEIRKRRSRNARRRSSVSVSRKAHKSSAAASPPVLVRGGQSSLPKRSPSKGKRAKRRYDIALNTPGAEMRLPSLPVVRFGWRVVSGLLVGILAFTLYTIWNSPMYQVSMVQVEGIRRLTTQDINTVANVSGKPVFSLDPRQIQRDLELAFTELESVSVQVGLPAEIHVSVVERQPVLTWEEDGHQMWIDAKGVAFSPRGEDGPAILVKSEGIPYVATVEAEQSNPLAATSRYLPPQLVSAILTISVQAPEGTPLVYTQSHGLGWRDPRGWEVYFGMNTDDMEMKLRVYKALVKRLKKEDIQPEMISVEYVHAPYYRLEP
jgi:cell division protein FtsQ